MKVAPFLISERTLFPLLIRKSKKERKKERSVPRKMDKWKNTKKRILD